MTVTCLLTAADMDEGEPWEYTPRCDSCGRWCRTYNDENTGDYRCPRCARKDTQ